MTPEQIATATAALACGKSQTETAIITGIPRSTLQYNIKKDEIAALIKDCQARLIKSSLTKAIENQASKIELSAELVNKARHGEEMPDWSKTYAELGTRAEEKLLESVGIHPSHTQSISLTQIMIDARSELSPTVERLLVEHLQGGVIDVGDPDRVTIGLKAGDKA